MERTVYLPDGCSWTNAFTGETYEGGQEITVKAPIETLPVFYRSDLEQKFNFA